MSMDQFAGIPGTISADTKGLRWHRCDDKGGARRYQADVPDGKLLALVSHDPVGKGGRLLWHLSVSHRDKADVPDRCPTWDELKHAAYRLVPADVCFILIFPQRSSPAPYVDVHPTTLHLWESEQEIDV